MRIPKVSLAALLAGMVFLLQGCQKDEPAVTEEVAEPEVVEELPPAWIDQSAAGTGLASDVSGSESRPTWPAAQSASQLARARRAMRPCFHSASAYHA